MALLNLISTINHTLDYEMGRDDRVVVFGEDVGVEGGVFRATVGLQEKYGADRCFDTPLAEGAIVGMAVGMAINGLRPVAEIQFSGFMYPAYNQIVSHVARMRNRTRGRLHLPLVIRMPHGGGIRPWSTTLKARNYFGAYPRPQSCCPFDPYDAKGLLLSAIRDDDPVIFLEPSKIYRAFRQEVPEGDYTIPIGKAKVVQEGEAVTVVTWGAYVHETLKAAEQLANEGIDAEVIDLRTISPIDRDTIIKSVKKTGRFVVVHEAMKTYGPGAELIALVNEKAFLYLEAPPTRLTGFDITIPLPRGEHHYFLDSDRIAAGIRKVVNF